MLSTLITIFKNVTVNYPARYFSPSLNVMILKFYGVLIRLFGNQQALQSAKLINSKLGVYRLTFWNGDSWLMVNHARINRYLKGIEAAGRRLQHRYNLDVTGMKVDCFVDVGANVGEISYVYARQGARVMCFEPDPNLRGILEYNLKSSGDVHISTNALGEISGSSEIWIATSNADTSLFPNRTGAARANIDVSRFDQHPFRDMIQGVAILKMDTEGFEPEALAGFGKELHKFSLIAVDCSEERGGESTAPDVKHLLVKENIFRISVSEDLIVNARQVKNKEDLGGG